MVWQENGTSVTTTGTETAMEISNLDTSLKFNNFLIYALQAATNNFVRVQLGSGTPDTSTNYSNRRSANGSEITSANDNVMQLGVFGGANDDFVYGYFVNISTEEKLVMSWENNQAALGAGTPPSREENAAKWVNTTNASNVLEAHSDTPTYAVNSNLSDLGTD